MEQNEFPTKGNLIHTQHTLFLARQGLSLLDQKRKVLIRELVKRRGQAEEMQSRIDKSLNAAKKSIIYAKIKMGAAKLEAASRSSPLESSIEIHKRSLMAVDIPQVEYNDRPINKVPYSLAGTAIALDESYIKFDELKKLIIGMAAIENTVFRLEDSVNKTQKRANALQHIVIPKYEARLIFIQNALEERERDGFVRMKLGKKG